MTQHVEHQPRVPPKISAHRLAERHAAEAVEAEVDRPASRPRVEASIVAPALGVAVGGALALRRGPTRVAGLGILAASIGFAIVRWQLARLFTETTEYRVVGIVGDLEIRDYPEIVLAETTVESVTWEDALDEGFRSVARYVFGANDANEHIAMTAPVFASVNAPPTTRAFTPPLEATTGDAPGLASDHTVAFVMPSAHAMDDLPWPNDARLRIRRVPPRRMAAIGFRGNYRSDLPSIMAAELIRKVKSSGLRPVGEVLFGGYDAPSTLPLLRRNEVLVEIADL